MSSDCEPNNFLSEDRFVKTYQDNNIPIILAIATNNHNTFEITNALNYYRMQYKSQDMNLCVGKTYFTSKNLRVKIVDILKQSDELYTQGYRFKSNIGICYKPDGTWCITPNNETYNLIKEADDEEG